MGSRDIRREALSGYYRSRAARAVLMLGRQGDVPADNRAKLRHDLAAVEVRLHLTSVSARSEVKMALLTEGLPILPILSLCFAFRVRVPRDVASWLAMGRIDPLVGQIPIVQSLLHGPRSRSLWQEA